MRQAFATQLALASGVLVILLALVFALLQTPGQAATTAVATAPLIPHPLAGYEDCVECHGRNGAIPYPANHLGWPNTSCTQCHLPADAAQGNGAPLAPAAVAIIGAQAIAATAIAPTTINAATPAEQVAKGESVFADRCTSCHVVGGAGPVLTAGGLAKYRTALELFAYTRRTMPPGAPRSLSAEAYWAVVAYMLAAAELLPADTVLDPATAGAVGIE